MIYIRSTSMWERNSFLRFKTIVIYENIHECTSVYDKRDYFRFPIVNVLWLNGDVLRLPSYGIYISNSKVDSFC